MLTSVLQHRSAVIGVQHKFIPFPPSASQKDSTQILPKGQYRTPIHFQTRNHSKTLFKSYSQANQASNGHEPSYPYGNGEGLMKFKMAWRHNIHSR